MNLLLETGDSLLLETGDDLLLDALVSGTLWRPFYAVSSFAGAVRAWFRAEGEIGIPGPALPGLSRLRPTFRRTEERFGVSVYGYIGRIDALSAVAALWSVTANPVELVTATSGIAATWR